jgi:WD40 repeat protein
MVCSPDKTHVATVAKRGQIRYRDASDKTIQYTFYICHPQAVCFSPDGTLLAAAGGRNGSPGKIKVWRISDGKELFVTVAVGQGVNALALSADGSLVAGASADGRVQVWRISDGQSQWSRTLSSAAESIQFSPDSKRLIVLTKNRSESHFDATNGRPITNHER